MEYIDNQWKLTHWHASTPVETENDHWHMEEWKREKEKLQQLVDQQTADLQKKNRELEIEASIERVRARSMAMQSSDELHDVLSVLFRQFDSLGIHPVNVFLSLFDREKRTLTYRASGKSGTRIPGKQVVEVDSMEPLSALYDKWINDNSDSVEVIYYPKEVIPQLFGIFADTFATMPERRSHGARRLSGRWVFHGGIYTFWVLGLRPSKASYGRRERYTFTFLPGVYQSIPKVSSTFKKPRRNPERRRFNCLLSAFGPGLWRCNLVMNSAMCSVFSFSNLMSWVSSL
jgi:hypothetical protein